MIVDQLDHLVLTVADIGRTCAFYELVLGMRHVEENGRHALRFGRQQINLHERGHEFEPKAQHPAPGSADLCFLTGVAMPAVLIHLGRCGIVVLEGPVHRIGAVGPMLSVYLRDPDGNLIEISTVAA